MPRNGPPPPPALDWRPFYAVLLNRFTVAAREDTEPRSMAEAVRRAREKAGLSNQQMATKMGTVAAHIHWIEQERYAKCTEAHFLAAASVAREAGLMKTASYIVKWAGPTFLAARAKRRRADA